MVKYVLYARKSTDEDDRQILSIEAQLTELKEYAAKEKLEIVASFEEAKTAKEPGRTKFGEMVNLLKAGKASGILAWHPDRLARNPIDGGNIIYLVDTGKIESLKFPTFWFENTPQGKFMLNIAFGQSKYFIDNLSENVKRGLRQKLRRGEFPSFAPIGFLNDLRTHAIVVDKTRHKLVQKLFELYSSGDYPFKALADMFNELGLRSQRNSKMSASMIQHILGNPFYCGVFRYNGELYEGKHEPIITKKLFDKCQEVMKTRGKPHKMKKHEFAFTGFMKCSCGCMITAETQKGYNYYRCTKKKAKCEEKYMREETLVENLKQTLQKVSLRDDWADKMLKKLDDNKEAEVQSSLAFVQNLKDEIKTIEEKLDRLLDSKLEGAIETSEYMAKKEKLISKKMEIEQKIKQIKNKGNNWLEPMRNFILQSRQAKKIAKCSDLSQIRQSIKNIGSNFILKGNLLFFEPQIGWRALTEREPNENWLRGLDSNQGYKGQNLAYYHYTTPEK